MIAKTIKSLLYNDGTLTGLVPQDRIFPYVMNEDTLLPAVIYTIDSVSSYYTKGGWANDEVVFSIHSFAKDYSTLQSVVFAVRGALEFKRTGSGTQKINNIYLTAIGEGYDSSADGFYNKLTFKVITNKY